MMNLGSQLINASQIMIISRWVSLEAAATFAIATKFQTMSMLLVINPVSASAAGLTELYVRGERERFTRRYWDMISLILLIATVAGASLAAGNRSVVSIWTGGSISWSWSNDLLLGLIVVLRSINGCLIALFGMIKNWRPVRHLYLAEGVCFVPLAVVGASHFGLSGILFASLACHLLVTTVFASKASAPIVGSSRRLLKRFFGSLILILLASLFGWFSQSTSLNPYASVVATCAIAAMAAAVGWLYFLPESIRQEARIKIHNAEPSIRRFFGRSVF
jgi:O-antigen/teichoic acid export membrane protein